MNETARHNRQAETFELLQGLDANFGQSGGQRPECPPSQIPLSGRTVLSDLTFPILRRTELLSDSDSSRWDTLATLTKSVLDKTTQRKGTIHGSDATSRFFGQLERLHGEFPDAIIKEFDNDDGQTTIAVYKPVHETSHIWAIPMEPIFSLRKKTPKLFTAILSFIHGLPFDNVIKRSGYIMECIWNWSLEIVGEETDNGECCADNGCVLCFAADHTKIYNNHCNKDWYTILKGYRPKKRLYRELRDLLLDSPNIDFDSFINLCFLSDECDLEVDDLVVFIDNQDSSMEGAYLSYINELAQNGYSHTIYDVAVGKMETVQGFCFDETSKVEEIFYFFEKLNRLITQL